MKILSDKTTRFSYSFFKRDFVSLELCAGAATYCIDAMEKRAWSDWLWVYVFHWKFALEQPPTALSHEEATMEGLMFVCSPVGEVLWRAVEEKCQRNIWVWNRRQTGQLHHHLQIPGRQGRLPTGGWFFLYGLLWRHQPYCDVINHIMTVINVGNNGLL